ncbi:unnamed protein product [Trifolium pratense]|uniref:Uncharacterized protein n=1 Tax=Trifolium pratense TaxID=57577 RepID=A0ACB0LGM3_TRIPR|nr:unnamed protein product [Trifolium pratense]
MGLCESRNFHLHAIFRDSPESRSAYIKGRKQTSKAAKDPTKPNKLPRT